MLTHWSQFIPNNDVNRHPRTLSSTSSSSSTINTSPHTFSHWLTVQERRTPNYCPGVASLGVVLARAEQRSQPLPHRHGTQKPLRNTAQVMHAAREFPDCCKARCRSQSWIAPSSLALQRRLLAQLTHTHTRSACHTCTRRRSRPRRLEQSVAAQRHRWTVAGHRIPRLYSRVVRIQHDRDMERNTLIMAKMESVVRSVDSG